MVDRDWVGQSHNPAPEGVVRPLRALFQTLQPALNRPQGASRVNALLSYNQETDDGETLRAPGCPARQ